MQKPKITSQQTAAPKKEALALFLKESFSDKINSRGIKTATRHLNLIADFINHQIIKNKHSNQNFAYNPEAVDLIAIFLINGWYNTTRIFFLPMLYKEINFNALKFQMKQFTKTLKDLKINPNDKQEILGKLKDEIKSGLSEIPYPENATFKIDEDNAITQLEMITNLMANINNTDNESKPANANWLTFILIGGWTYTNNLIVISKGQEQLAINLHSKINSYLSQRTTTSKPEDAEQHRTQESSHLTVSP